MKTEKLSCSRKCPYKLPGETQLSCGQGFSTGADQGMHKCDETRETLLARIKQMADVTEAKYTATFSGLDPAGSAILYLSKATNPDYHHWPSWQKAAEVKDGKIEWFV